MTTKICGTYKIICLSTGTMYIGSSNSLERRLKDHLSFLRNKTHRNLYLQRAWDKYGEENFTFEIDEITSTVEIARKAEQKLLDKFFETEKLFNVSNLARGGTTGPRPDWVKEKISKSHVGIGLGKKSSEETKRKISQRLTGRTWKRSISISDEEREKRRQSMLGKNKGKPGKTKGRQWTEEHRKKAIEGLRIFHDDHPGYFKHSEETKQKIREKSEHMSGETKKKISDGVKAAIRRRKEMIKQSLTTSSNN